MIEHKPNSDASGFYRARSNGHESQSMGSAQCGNLADFTANSTFIVQQTTYHPLPVLPGVVITPSPRPDLNSR
jgi:hypothetical protein